MSTISYRYPNRKYGSGLYGIEVILWQQEVEHKNLSESIEKFPTTKLPNGPHSSSGRARVLQTMKARLAELEEVITKLNSLL